MRCGALRGAHLSLPLTLHAQCPAIGRVVLANRQQQASRHARRQQGAGGDGERRDAQRARRGARRRRVDAQAGAAEALAGDEQDGGVDQVKLHRRHLCSRGQGHQRFPAAWGLLQPGPPNHHPRLSAVRLGCEQRAGQRMSSP